MARQRQVGSRNALSSFKDDIQNLWTDLLRPSTPWGTDPEPIYLFQGINLREALSTLNRRYFEFLSGLQNRVTSSTMRQYINLFLDTLPAGPGIAAAGPGVLFPGVAPAHGIRYIPALSLATIFAWILATIDDNKAVYYSLSQLRRIPGIQNYASLALVLPTDPLFRVRNWTQMRFESIAATFVASFRSIYVEDDEFMGTISWCPIRQTAAVGPANIFMGTDGPATNVAVPFCATANAGHLGGGGTPAQATAAAAAAVSDIMLGATPADPSAIGTLLDFYDQFVDMLEKHCDVKPIYLDDRSGGTVIPFIAYHVVDTFEVASGWLPSDVVSEEAMELGTALRELTALSVPIVNATTLFTSVKTLIKGTDTVANNSGAAGNNNSVRIATRHNYFRTAFDAWKRYSYQHVEFPMGLAQPRNQVDYSQMIKKKIQEARDEQAAKRQKLEEERQDSKDDVQLASLKNKEDAP